jgi:hypothetical protein
MLKAAHKETGLSQTKLVEISLQKQLPKIIKKFKGFTENS